MENSKTPRQKSKDFLEYCLNVLTAAHNITQERTAMGENDVTPLPDIFGDIDDVLAFMKQKLQRCRNYTTALENLSSEVDRTAVLKMLEDSWLDLINYTSFFAVMHKLREADQHARRNNSPDSSPRGLGEGEKVSPNSISSSGR